MQMRAAERTARRDRRMAVLLGSGSKRVCDGHTGARTQDHSVISTALYRLSYTTARRRPHARFHSRKHAAHAFKNHFTANPDAHAFAMSVLRCAKLPQTADPCLTPRRRTPMTNRSSCLTQMGHKPLQKQQHDVGAQEMQCRCTRNVSTRELLCRRC